MGKKGMGKFVFGAALGAGLGMLFAPKLQPLKRS